MQNTHGIFTWNSKFETGIELVDKQHRHLVDLINALGYKISQDKVLSIDEITQLCNELFDYAKYHFGTEEKLMAEYKLSHEFIKDHVSNHQAFFVEVDTLYSELNKGTMENVKIKNLLDFLVNWLAFHILGQDKKMAKQIELIQNGASKEEAYNIVNSQSSSEEVGPLVNALNKMLEMLSKRNKELLLLKNELEIKVEERTKELLVANEHLKRLSITDQLTELPNRRYAMQTLDMLWKESLEYNFPLSVLMMDLDHFKEINDTYGHDAGDIVLKTVVIALKDSVRTDDVICRLGGDEFLLICPNTKLEGAIQVGNTILKNVKMLNIKLKETTCKAHISIGIASKTDSMTSYNELIKQADTQVYNAKHNGKCCVSYEM
ncbi:diguanylate cyclase [Campylobacter iguaniorum]|uniref:GGDEF domain-containing protein n=1 Tax=Campylobacter iguaniorum TaxID=1244531 RepID=UPI00073A04BB|nr:GGDEF domain-containing protein [Campylobacter iguaniorum]ALV24281.1 diguanylate cyclase [Campylobacter iguaniorum]